VVSSTRTDFPWTNMMKGRAVTGDPGVDEELVLERAAQHELVSSTPLRNGAVAMHYRRV
jgi:hypothetical protein